MSGLVAATIDPIGRDHELSVAVDALTHSSGVLLTGAPGVGKTHLARRIAAWYASTNPAVPLVYESAADGLMPRRSGNGALGDVIERVIVLEGAHLLDADDLAALARACRNGSTQLVATAHTTPPALGHLVRDGVLAHRTIPTFDAGEVAELVRALLGGIIATEVIWFVWQTSAGNARHAIDLVESAVADGDLARRDGTWLFVRPPRPSSRILDLVATELQGLSTDERDLIDIVALGGPVPLETVLATSNSDALDAQVAAGRLVTGIDETESRPFVATRHPRFGDIAAMLVPPARRRHLFERVLGSDRLPDGPPAHVVSTVRWALSSATPIDACELLRAGRIASDLGRIDITEQLTTAALGGFETHRVERIETLLLRSMARRMAGRTADALADARTAHKLAAVADADATTRAEWSFQAAVAYANLMQFSLGDVDGAVAFLDEERRHVGIDDACATATLRSRARADQTMRLAYSTRFAEADFARPTPEELPALPPEIRIEHQVALTFGEAYRGNLIDAREQARRLAVDTLALGTNARWGPVQAQALLFVVLGWLGEINDAVEYLKAVESDPHMPGFVEPAARQIGHGGAAMARGDWATATTNLNAVVARFRIVDISGWLPVGLSWLATARAANGQRVEAASILAEARTTPPRASGLMLFDLWDHWWRVAFTLGSPDANKIARSMIDRGRSDDLALVEVWGWHALAVITGGTVDRDEALKRLNHLETCVQGVLPAVRINHARSLLGGDEAVATATVGRLAELGFWVPFVSNGSVATLTDRQLQVAQLAATGLSSTAIAERLFISKRTVDAHLNSIFDRLGVRNRADLTAILTSTSSTQPRSPGPR